MSAGPAPKAAAPAAASLEIAVVSPAGARTARENGAVKIRVSGL